MITRKKETECLQFYESTKITKLTKVTSDNSTVVIYGNLSSIQSYLLLSCLGQLHGGPFMQIYVLFMFVYRCSGRTFRKWEWRRRDGNAARRNGSNSLARRLFGSLSKLWFTVCHCQLSMQSLVAFTMPSDSSGNNPYGLVMPGMDRGQLYE